VGEAGTSWRFEGGAWRRVRSRTGAARYGVWGARPDDVWAVGQGGVVVHFGGVAWDLEATGFAPSGDYYKVWGAAADDLFVVGEGGAMLHRSCAGWTRMDAGTDATLRTVTGRRADDVWTVGGLSGAVVLHFDGGAW